MRIERSRMWDREGLHALSDLFRVFVKFGLLFGLFSLRNSPPFHAGPHAEGFDISDFFDLGHREGLHVAHQGVLHANVVTLRMWHIKECRMPASRSSA